MEILSLGEKIKRKRKERNMTLKDLAGDKVTPGQISLVESGKSKPSIDLLEYIAQKLDVGIDYILETEEHQAEKLCEYYSKIADASIIAENYEQAREAISKGITYASQYNLQYYIGLNEFYTGMIEYGLGNYENAQSMFISSNEIFLRIGNVRNIIDTYVHLGMVSYKLMYFNSSLSYYRQAEKIVNENKIVDNDILTNVYFYISLCYSKLGNNNAAIDYLLLTMEKFKERNDKFQYGQSLLMLSISYKSLDRFEEALLYANRAVGVFKELDNLFFVAKVETNMGVVLSDLGNTDDSFKHLEKACRIKMQIKDKTTPETMLRLADNYIKINDIDKAMEIVNEAYEKYNEDIYSQYRPSIYYYLHKLCVMKQDEKRAELYLFEAIKYLQSMDMKRETADTYVMLGEFYESMGNGSEALKYMSKGINIYKELGIIPESIGREDK